MHVKQKYGIPVIASFGNVCASGGNLIRINIILNKGYYVASACDEIISQKGTITGSIGVASARPIILPKLLEATGITIDEISESDGFKNQSAFKHMDARGKFRGEERLDETFELFVGKVMQGRGMTRVEAGNVAGGRVFSGEDAATNGLVDQIG